MPVFQFEFGPPAAGCVAKVVVQTPWSAAQNYENPSQAFPNGRNLSPPEAAFAFLCNYGNRRDQAGNCALYFPPNAKPICRPVGKEDGQPAVLAVECYQPTVDRQQTNAPYGQPVGNGHSYQLPPEQPKPNDPRSVPQGMYDALPDCALGNTSDNLMGEADPEGGTYTDYSPTDKTEVIRQIAMPYGKNVHDR